MSLLDKDKFVSSANMTGFKIEEALWRSLTYMRNSNGPRIEHCGMPQIILHMLVLPTSE